MVEQKQSGRAFNIASNFSRRIESPVSFSFGRTIFDFGLTMSDVRRYFKAWLLSLGFL